MLAVVEEICVHGCWLVVLVRCRATGRLMAYCDGCLSCWTTPGDFRSATWSDPVRECPAGVELPTAEEVAQSIWSDLVREYMPEDESWNADAFNDWLARERERRTREPLRAGPGPRPHPFRRLAARFFPRFGGEGASMRKDVGPGRSREEAGEDAEKHG
ncbi:hypothetical protein [Tautonia plasticadhaerens]|uniref:Uncharacterized protein n=1 Tax=Tautonia plasticadhaerens TaxID=2527974 RepID=A0A518H5A4_9BACT|nr:hypothetical protein [Tautonia plasticadhaerens]QDV36024.1 hypothetical protein ElP_39340 [Tautonia plasticadhaerens]